MRHRVPRLREGLGLASLPGASLGQPEPVLVARRRGPDVAAAAGALGNGAPRAPPRVGASGGRPPATGAGLLEWGSCSRNPAAPPYWGVPPGVVAQPPVAVRGVLATPLPSQGVHAGGRPAAAPDRPGATRWESPLRRRPVATPGGPRGGAGGAGPPDEREGMIFPAPRRPPGRKGEKETSLLLSFSCKLVGLMRTCSGWNLPNSTGFIWCAGQKKQLCS